MRELLGRPVADAITKKVREKALAAGVTPKAVILRVGERPEDLAYERGILARLGKCGLEAQVKAFPVDVTQAELEQAILAANTDANVHGILLFCPLPGTLDQKRLCSLIDPLKDLDGVNPLNQAKIFAGDTSGSAPCTAEAVMEILKFYETPLAGRKCVIIGRSMVIGRPVSMMLLQSNATVTMTHTKTRDLVAECRQADIIVAAAGRAGLVTADFVKPGAVLIDVGINMDKTGHLVGDVNASDVRDRSQAAGLTPVPRGVGSVTSSILALHLLRAALALAERDSAS